MTNTDKPKHSDAEIERMASIMESGVEGCANMLRQLLAERNERQPVRGVVSDDGYVAEITRHDRILLDGRYHSVTTLRAALEAHESAKESQ